MNLELHFQITDRGRECIARGRVIRVERNGLTALGFHNLSPATRERLRKSIETHLPDLRERAADRKSIRTQRG